MSIQPTRPPTPTAIDSTVTRLVQRELHDRRFSALAAAVRAHEARARGLLVGLRAHDLELYRSLRRICGEL